MNYDDDDDEDEDVNDEDDINRRKTQSWPSKQL